MTPTSKNIRKLAIAGLVLAGGLFAASAQAQNFSQNNVTFRASPATVQIQCERLGMAYKALANKFYTCDGVKFVCHAGACKGRTYGITAPNHKAIDDPAGGEGGGGDGGGGR